MNDRSTDSAARCGEEKGGHVFLQLDEGYRRPVSKGLGRDVALPLRQPFNTDRRRTLWIETICITFRFDNCYFSSHKLGEVLAAPDRLRTYLRPQKQQDDENCCFHCHDDGQVHSVKAGQSLFSGSPNLTFLTPKFPSRIEKTIRHGRG